MIQHIKNFWKRYVVSAVVIPSAFAAGVEMGGKAPAPLDCKGQVCIVQTIYDKDGNRGQIIYTPDEWQTKTSDDLKADVQKRIDEKRIFIEAQSKLTRTEDELIK